MITRACAPLMLATLIGLPSLSAAEIPPQVYFDPVTQEDWSCFMFSEGGEVINLESMCGNTAATQPLTLAERLRNYYQARFCDPRSESVINPNTPAPSSDLRSRNWWRADWAGLSTLLYAQRHSKTKAEREEVNQILDKEVYPNVIQSLDDCP
jgi:hypothetical protein